MNSQTDQLQTIITEIDQTLSKASPNLPWVISGTDTEQRQLLEKVRNYLMFLQSTGMTDPTVRSQIEPRGGAGQNSYFTNQGPLGMAGESASQQAAQQILQAVMSEMGQLRTTLAQPLQADLERLQQQRAMLQEEIKQLESQRQAYQMAPGGSYQLSPDVIQSLIGRLQETLAQQMAWMQTYLPTQAGGYASTYPTTFLTGSPADTPSQFTLAEANEQLEKLRTIQAKSDQVLMTLDSTLNIVFEALQKNLRTYQDSLGQGLEKMYSLGNQGEMMFTAWMNLLIQQLACEPASYLQAAYALNRAAAGSTNLAAPQYSLGELTPETQHILKQFGISLPGSGDRSSAYAASAGSRFNPEARSTNYADLNKLELEDLALEDLDLSDLEFEGSLPEASTSGLVIPDPKLLNLTETEVARRDRTERSTPDGQFINAWMEQAETSRSSASANNDLDSALDFLEQLSAALQDQPDQSTIAETETSASFFSPDLVESARFEDAPNDTLSASGVDDTGIPELDDFYNSLFGDVGVTQSDDSSEQNDPEQAIPGEAVSDEISHDPTEAVILVAAPFVAMEQPEEATIAMFDDWDEQSDLSPESDSLSMFDAEDLFAGLTDPAGQEVLELEVLPLVLQSSENSESLTQDVLNTSDEVGAPVGQDLAARDSERQVVVPTRFLDQGVIQPEAIETGFLRSPDRDTAFSTASNFTLGDGEGLPLFEDFFDPNSFQTSTGPTSNVLAGSDQLMIPPVAVNDQTSVGDDQFIPAAPGESLLSTEEVETSSSYPSEDISLWLNATTLQHLSEDLSSLENSPYNASGLMGQSLSGRVPLTIGEEFDDHPPATTPQDTTTDQSLDDQPGLLGLETTASNQPEPPQPNFNALESTESIDALFPNTQAVTYQPDAVELPESIADLFLFDNADSIESSSMLLPREAAPLGSSQPPISPEVSTSLMAKVPELNVDSDETDEAAPENLKALVMGLFSSPVVETSPAADQLAPDPTQVQIEPPQADSISEPVETQPTETLESLFADTPAVTWRPSSIEPFSRNNPETLQSLFADFEVAGTLSSESVNPPSGDLFGDFPHPEESEKKKTLTDDIAPIVDDGFALESLQGNLLDSRSPMASTQMEGIADDLGLTLEDLQLEVLGDSDQAAPTIGEDSLTPGGNDLTLDALQREILNDAGDVDQPEGNDGLTLDALQDDILGDRVEPASPFAGDSQALDLPPTEPFVDRPNNLPIAAIGVALLEVDESPSQGQVVSDEIRLQPDEQTVTIPAANLEPDGFGPRSIQEAPLPNVWYLGLDLGETGISAVLLNRQTGKMYPICWQLPTVETSEGMSFRLPAVAYLPGDEAAAPLGVGQPMVAYQHYLEAARRGVTGFLVQHWKPYLKAVIPYRSDQSDTEQPIFQWSTTTTLSLSRLQTLLETLLNTLTNPELGQISATGLEQSLFETAIYQLAGIVVGYPHNWPDTYSFNLREAILSTGLVDYPDQIFLVEEAIATVLSGLPACREALQLGNRPNRLQKSMVWRGSTLVISAGAIGTDIGVVLLPEQLEQLNHADFNLHRLAYGGHALDQDILCQVIYPEYQRQLAAQEELGVSNGLAAGGDRQSNSNSNDPTPHFTLTTDGTSWSSLLWPDVNPLTVGEPDTQARMQLQQRLEGSVLGKSLLEAAQYAKLILQQHDRLTLELGHQTWVITRRQLESQVFLPFIQRLNRELNTLLSQAGFVPQAINQAVCTGGTASLPAIARWLRQKLPNATIIQDSYPTDNIPLSILSQYGFTLTTPAPVCSRVAYGLATLPLYPQVLEVSRQQYSDYFLLSELLKMVADWRLREAPVALSRSNIMGLLEQRGINTFTCDLHLLALLEGHLPPGLVPIAADVVRFSPTSLANPLYRSLTEAPLFTQQIDGEQGMVYRPNFEQCDRLQTFLTHVLAHTQQTLQEPLSMLLEASV